MANVTVTSTANSVLVDFGVYTPQGMTKGVWAKSAIRSFRLTSDRVQVNTNDGAFDVCYSSTDSALIIDTVNGAAPSSLNDLYTKLAALIA